MAVSAISSGNGAGLAALQSLSSLQPSAVVSAAAAPGRDKDGDNDNEATESGAVKAAASRGPLPTNGSVGRKIDVSA